MLLFLKKATVANSRDWFVLVQTYQDELGEWLPHLRQLSSLEKAEAYIQKNKELDFYLGEDIYLIWSDNQVIGLIGLHSGRIQAKSVELWYWIAPPFQQQGFATTACELLLSHTFSEYAIDSIKINCHRANVASQRLAQKLHFKLATQSAIINSYYMTKASWMSNYYDDEYYFYFLDRF